MKLLEKLARDYTLEESGDPDALLAARHYFIVGFSVYKEIALDYLMHGDDSSYQDFLYLRDYFEKEVEEGDKNE